MNERIKELNRAAQAYAEKLVGNDEDSNFSLWVEIYKEKLAELIVKECVEQIINRERSDGEWYQDDIFKHFGVKE